MSNNRPYLGPAKSKPAGQSIFSLFGPDGGAPTGPPAGEVEPTTPKRRTNRAVSENPSSVDYQALLASLEASSTPGDRGVRLLSPY